MAGGTDDLDAKIGQLLLITPSIDQAPSVDRENNDFLRLQNLGVGTTTGDTLVIVKFPTGNYVNCCGNQWTTKEFLMNSYQLLGTGSSVFAEKLSPEAQAQARRRLARSNRTYPQTPFVLDLTPPIEGDESASLVAQLSLSNGIRNWWQSYSVFTVSAYLVLGHDDVCPQHFDVLLSGIGSPDPRTKNEEPIDIDSIEYPVSRRIDDYCPIRHRAAILRLLIAISQGELVLNSAPRTASIAVVAKALDCVGVVTDSVLSWFIAEPNQNFISNNAEDALQIAWMLEIPSVARVAFRILVTEKAIEILSKHSGANTNNSHNQPSVFGRPRGTVDEEPETCIQHAAQRLAQRAEEVSTGLLPNNIHKFLRLLLWPEGDANLCQLLHQYMNHVVLEAAGFDLDMSVQDRYRASYEPVGKLTPTRDIYLQLQPAQRVLTVCFWRMLEKHAHSVPLFERFFTARYYPLNKESRPYGFHFIPDDGAYFDVHEFHHEFKNAITALSYRWRAADLEVNILQSGPLVLNLSDEEFRFLPLWAGGWDDGTGGVFQAEIPDADRGVPIGPGPSFRTGETLSGGDDDDDSTVKGSGGAPTIVTETGTGSSITKGYSVHATNSHSSASSVVAPANNDFPLPLPIRQRPISPDGSGWSIVSAEQEDASISSDDYSMIVDDDENEDEDYDAISNDSLIWRS
ncbi:hypothetical protein F4777DRAFT_346466 [Nemania sp. FL0916]|nr:hypothetical protein F4777DRAFT_346466 [Nemania sp. FL0916]